ncbi:MAG TPA: biotin-dependent carboxyltransferase family protein [Chitinophagaceae bacterium]|nr:biotin-dependent carboxyltransferase family protein [Chitinophagaceae bacterium]
MSLRIIKAGVMDTIQDAGRYGFRHLGINPAGSMDQYAMRIANILVGNKPGEPVIELHFPASAIFFEQPALIAITGGDFTPTVNAENIPLLQPVLINRFGILQFEGMRSGSRAYVAIRGGLKISKWLNSYSTHLRAIAGGFNGRILAKDDEIGISQLDESYIRAIEKKEFLVFPWKADNKNDQSASNEILILPGNEWDLLTNESKDKFLGQTYTITANSDRMGYRLDSKELLSVLSNQDMISSAVSFGTVQLLPDGKLIVLMADHQATGGYPKLAHVISAHHSRLAQMKAGDRFNFSITDLQDAEDMFIAQQQHLIQLENGCRYRLEQFLKS